MKSFANALLPLLAFSYTASATCSNYQPVATVASGVVLGTTTSFTGATATVNKFLGIPYAASPTRFEPPTQPTSWSTPINATAFKDACIQQFVYPLVVREFTMAIFNNPGGGPAPPESEDCLYINVFAPSSLPPLGGFPVMQWIYGGALEFGSSNVDGYDGSNFAAFQDVIVVTFNYRTNIFGFPSAPEIPPTKRNLGFLDQRMALEWTRENIRAFGGNPNKVTIFGESSGAESVDILLNSWQYNPPFRAGIMESGNQALQGFLTNGVNVTANWYKAASYLNCTGNATQCLQTANATQLESVISMNNLLFQPQIDNYTVVSDPSARIANGSTANVPILVGSNAQEGRVFQYGQTNVSTVVAGLFPGITAYQDLVKQTYAINSTVNSGFLSNDFDAASAIYTDLVFTCPTSYRANISAAANIPTWRYYYNASFPNLNFVPNLGVYHSSEISIVFGTYPNTSVTAQEYALSKTMQTAWANFAKNPKGGPGWNAVGTFNGTDLGVLGAYGQSGVDVINSSYVDDLCGVFAPVYTVLGNLG